MARLTISLWPRSYARRQAPTARSPIRPSCGNDALRRWLGVVDCLYTNWYKATYPRGPEEPGLCARVRRIQLGTATVEEVQLLKTLRWWDGFVIALCNPGFLLGSLGFTLGIFGVGGSMILWGLSATIGLLQAWIYSEPATMFGHRSGGIALYAHEGWRKYTTLVGPLSAFGYWIGWSVVLSIFGKIIGDLATSQWWPNSGLSIGFAGNTLTLSSFIAIGLIIFVWVFNIFGLPLAGWVTYACAGVLIIPLALFIIVPYFTGDWHSSNVHATFPGPWGGLKVAIVFMFIL